MKGLICEFNEVMQKGICQTKFLFFFSFCTLIIPFKDDTQIQKKNPKQNKQTNKNKTNKKRKEKKHTYTSKI